MAVEEKKRRFAQAWTEIVGDAAGEAPAAPPSLAHSINISGGNVVFGDSVVHRNVFNVKPRFTVVQTGVGVLDAGQKARLLELRDQIVGVSRAVEGQQVTAATIMRKLNAHMKVNSYSEIAGEDFAKAESYLVRWRARLDGMPGANRSAGWRDRRIRAIHARCKELGCDQWRINYMRKAWGKESLIDLPDEHLEKIYLAVMRRK